MRPGWAGAHVPGAGLVRDGSRLLVLCLPLLACWSAHGAAELGRLPARTGPARCACAAAVLVAAAGGADAGLALGVAGRLRGGRLPGGVRRGARPWWRRAGPAAATC